MCWGVCSLYREKGSSMVKLLIAAVLLGGFSTYVVHSKHTSNTLPLPTTVHEFKSQARVNMRSFHLPQVNGKMVRFCLSHLNQCGKPAADAFCRINGFKEAFTFQRNGSDETTVTNFRQINCRHSAKTADADQVHDFSGDRIMLAENHLFRKDISNIVEHAPVVSRMAGARPPKGAFVG